LLLKQTVKLMPVLSVTSVGGTHLASRYVDEMDPIGSVAEAASGAMSAPVSNCIFFFRLVVAASLLSPLLRRTVSSMMQPSPWSWSEDLAYSGISAAESSSPKALKDLWCLGEAVLIATAGLRQTN